MSQTINITGDIVDYQTAFNLAFTVILLLVGGLGGWILGALSGSIKDMQSADKELAAKVAAVEVLVAGQYVTREEFQRDIGQLFSKLDKISDQLSRKVDR